MSLFESSFFLICFVQVLWISFYYPRHLRDRILYVLENYPPSTHPKLYPSLGGIDPVPALRKVLAAYWIANLLIALGGLGLIAAAIANGYVLGPKGGAEKWVIAYFMLQMLPHAALELSAIGFTRLARQSAPGVRRATLAPRRLADFISPAAVMTALMLYAVWVVVYLYYQGDDPWNGRSLFTLIFVTLGHLFFLYLTRQALFGRRRDPHQTEKDRARYMVLVARISVVTSIFVSVFLIVTDLVRAYELDRFEPILTSLYLQALLVLSYRSACGINPLSSRDFSVYQETTSVPG